MTEFSSLLELARIHGAAGAALIDPAEITVRDELARMCFEPRCDGYGRSLSCPPHVGGPEAFRRWQKEYKIALVFKVEVPREVAMSFERNEILALIHEIGSGVEREAKKMGAERARTFAGGSCKELFCSEYPECRVLDEGKSCRNPHRARPSMSGHGIDVARLQALAGWKMPDPKEKPKEGAMASFTGLVLLE
jgi:predicted metal-binding protein